MSYCRFSDDDYACDVYVYADVNGGITIHVASNRLIFTEPLPPKISFEQDPEGYYSRMRAVSIQVFNAAFEPIDLGYDGPRSINLDSKEAAEFLEKLIALGYRVPKGVVEALREPDNDAE